MSVQRDDVTGFVTLRGYRLARITGRISSKWVFARQWVGWSEDRHSKIHIPDQPGLFEVCTANRRRGLDVAYWVVSGVAGAFQCGQIQRAAALALARELHDGTAIAWDMWRERGDTYVRERRAARRTELQALADACDTRALPSLRGTPAQIRWATVIRDALARLAPDHRHCRRCTRAKWWIEHREQIAVVVASLPRAEAEREPWEL
ncbi:hypothetical protein [Hydrocarboniphaga effusa]|jgi:hypothetical protein|uniref:hypothetical protein n=1 Tax=Hydrocarboniphaga effusa TaxID=243629 RepID=UPI003137FF98